MSCDTSIWREENGVKIDLEDLFLIKDDDGYRLDIKYRIETDRNVREVQIPNARLAINPHGFMISNEKSGCVSLGTTCDIGFGPMKLKPDNKGCYWYNDLIEEKTKEMTLEEIEKKLGHKVNIVSKE